MDFTLIAIIANLAIVVTIMSFFTGIEICLNIWKKRSSNDIPSAPLIAGFLCTSLWLRYGLYVNDVFLVAVNAIGVICFTSYLIFYYCFTLNKMGLNRKLFLAISVLLSVIVISKKSDNPSYYSGLSASLFGVLFTMSPLASVVDVVKSKSTERMPFFLILSTFAVTLLWFFYGVLKNDNFVKVPNALSAMISGCQLLLFILYPNSETKEKESKLSLLTSNSDPHII